MAFFQAAFRFYHEDKSSNFSFKHRPYFALAANEEEAQRVLNKRPDIGAGGPDDLTLTESGISGSQILDESF